MKFEIGKTYSRLTSDENGKDQKVSYSILASCGNGFMLAACDSQNEITLCHFDIRSRPELEWEVN